MTETGHSSSCVAHFGSQSDSGEPSTSSRCHSIIPPAKVEHFSEKPCTSKFHNFNNLNVIRKSSKT